MEAIHIPTDEIFSPFPEALQDHHMYAVQWNHFLQQVKWTYRNG